MGITREGYCSWCFEYASHELHEPRKLRRHLYQCKRCGNFTVKCRYCRNMARSLPNDWQERQASQGRFKNIKMKWNHELCAEHDGTIASFAHLSDTWRDLEDYKILFKREKKNLLKAGKYAGGIIGGTIVLGPLTYLAAPGIASALGAAGLLGAASTGTAISSLSGAALTSASLAAIGGGAMATGVAFLTAAGAGLGAVQGGVISNRYAGAIKNFAVDKCNEGKSPAIIFIDGFLNQKNTDTYEWRQGLRPFFSENLWYHIKWESKTLRDLGQLAFKDVSGNKLRKLAVKLAKRSSQKIRSKLHPITWATFLADLASNPWHVAMVKASMTGILLADLLCRVKDTEFILIGHSLGARVLYYTLNSLSTRPHPCVKDVYLLGGAVDSTNKEGWTKASEAVEGQIYNCYSSNDSVLKYLYSPANLWLSHPIGLGPISCPAPNICNVDVSECVPGHMYYKVNLEAILKHAMGGN